MNYSGIFVRCAPEHFHQCIARLRALEGVEVHHTDADTGRIVVVQEAPAVDAEVEGLKRIQSLPNVIAADLVYHYFGDTAETEADLEAALARLADPPLAPSAD